MTITLEYKAEDRKFKKKFDDSLSKLELGEMRIINFSDKITMRNFTLSFFNDLVKTNHNREYEHQIYEGILSYTIRRVK